MSSSLSTESGRWRLAAILSVGLLAVLAEQRRRRRRRAAAASLCFFGYTPLLKNRSLWESLGNPIDFQRGECMVTFHFLGKRTGCFSCGKAGFGEGAFFRSGRCLICVERLLIGNLFVKGTRAP